ncbi:unnamed protein product [Eruca vesicaria subsp. sativa]|uniref:MADS-box domain-containing protein n=1 Tax=Eruca vesicaria subsp. sativa TaxID=29727 RepID=A0ABC8ITH5_ERUVS|nr:unnamed protein product [Eruca vesicaria subsp. sativa]
MVLKKAYELSVLCDAEIALLIFSNRSTSSAAALGNKIFNISLSSPPKFLYLLTLFRHMFANDFLGGNREQLKPGSAIPEKGKKITLSVKNIADLSRDVIKSDTAGVNIPELDLELAGGTLGGMVTTVEGLVTQIRESLARVHGFTFGDSLDESKKNKWKEFGARITKLLSLEEPWTLILDDELANSFISPVTDDIKDDNQLTFNLSNTKK